MAGAVHFFSSVDWIFKGGVFRTNLKKLYPPDPQSRLSKFLWGALLVLLSALLSWIQVLLGLGEAVWRFVKIVREVFAAVPQDIKRLRFPLHNNPDMSREAVWAYVCALNAKEGGVLATPSKLLESLEAVRQGHEYFDPRLALKHLAELRAVSAETVDATMEHFSR